MFGSKTFSLVPRPSVGAAEMVRAGRDVERDTAVRANRGGDSH